LCIVIDENFQTIGVIAKIDKPFALAQGEPVYPALIAEGNINP